ncbi:MAG TPA: 2Fe-2S iron-sulfur cluster-binding protein [Alphaproteobacteria bacterium]|nr:2Fe-2S iron-sulfur cluster-binding protein [Alphaproteobacteria bacterium]
MAPITLNLTVNGRRLPAMEVEPDLPLLSLLQDELGLTGTKFCCGIGVCRACTVAVRRGPEAGYNTTPACVTRVAEMQGQEVLTVEGLAPDGGLSPLQVAFLDEFAFQCGYCAPGFLTAAHAFIEGLRSAPVAEAELDRAILTAVGDHICRCTGYVRYLAAIRKVALATPGLVR